MEGWAQKVREDKGEIFTLRIKVMLLCCFAVLQVHFGLNYRTAQPAQLALPAQPAQPA
jgi:hypothetical protein